MANPRDRILLVESDPVVSDLIGRQVLQASGYQVFVAADASTAINKALQWSPDLIITNINLPGLSGKDLMVALASQGITTPVIILAQRGVEAEIIQTFRLGASDYLLLPAREAEVVSAVTRVLKQVYDRRERDRLAQQLQQTNLELQTRVRELTTIFAVGKAVTSVTEQSTLMDKVLDGALRVTQADLGWFLLRDDTDKAFTLVAERNLPAGLGVRIGQPWDDGISSLVAMSGEALAIHGEPLKRFKIFSLGLSALIVPIKVQKKVVGLLVTMRKQAMVFAASDQHLLEALADYASISLVNARLFRTVEDRARSLQTMAETALVGETVTNEVLHLTKQALNAPLLTGQSALEKLARDPTARWRPEQRQGLSAIQDQLVMLRQLMEAITPLAGAKRAERVQVSLTDQVRLAVRRFQPLAQQLGLSLVTEMPSEPMMVAVESSLLAQVVDSLISHALRYSAASGLVTIQLAHTADQQTSACVKSTTFTIDAQAARRLMDDSDKAPAAWPRFGGLGVRLNVLKQIVLSQRGKIWVEGQPGKEQAICFSLPMAR